MEAQRRAVQDYLCGRRHNLISEWVEIESGRLNDRPELGEALAMCRTHRATLIIAKLDRLARNVALVSNLLESGVDFVAADFPEANRLTIHILAAVAEHEAKMISDRTRAALHAARMRGVALGGDRGNLPGVAGVGAVASAIARSKRADERAKDLAPVVAKLRNAGLTFRQVAGELNSSGVRAARGGEWSAAQVSRLLQRGARWR